MIPTLKCMGSMSKDRNPNIILKIVKIQTVSFNPSGFKNRNRIMIIIKK